MARTHTGLIRRFARSGITNDDHPLTDLLLALAANIEDALIESGAAPGKDYQVLDLFKLANPYALARWSDEDSRVSIEL